jgi:hypothetical protein
MSASLVIKHLILLATILGFVAGLNALFGNLSWLEVSVATLGLYLVPALVERFFGRRDRESSGS